MKDILLDEDKDLLFANGDLAVGESDLQHQELLLISNKGVWKENPTIGVGIQSWLKDNEPDGLLAEVKKEFERDGMLVKSIEINNEILNVDASY